MSFFQNSVLNKHLKAQDDDVVQSAYKQFTAYFHDAVRQQNIRDAKEEQFQEGFLRELFVKILGYTLNPEPNYNLTTELKNEKGAKKCDGAILKDGKALGVIELKGTDTKDLDKINTQAFNYKNNQTGCVYVVTSNFEKLRFFVHNAVEHIEFNLFTLTLDEFKVMWLCLQVENVLGSIPLKVKEESLLAEENITKQLYKDYSAFKTDMWQSMVKNHPEHDQLMLFKKTQMLLDRFLFIFFAEDSGLLPPNSISKIIEKWNHDKDWGESKSLYEIYKQYFGFINSGRPASGNRAEIFGYNGGLFQGDLILDNIIIDDEILLKHTQKLTAYDFQSEVDVNILGHIFENSLNEIENITAELEGQEIDKSKTKRKKDGVFYTPKYITKYIVDNTIGKLCDEKKAELNITDERFAEAGKRSKKGVVDLKTYRDWLLDLKICDPACGSGAFLNQALEFLIDEHQYLDELTALYHKSPLVLSDIETQILEQNIYGVDINEESVEIAKLSLWLRTAQRGRKLTSLNNNLKCGNSLIDDETVAGEKAFNWQKEFPKVFEKGGFDIILGNPPYVFTRGNEHLQRFNEYIWENFEHNHGKINLYSVFLEISLSRLLRKHGRLGFITPETFIRTSTYGEIRRYLINSLLIESISVYGIGVFDNVTAETITMIIKKDYNPNNVVGFYKHQSIEDYLTFWEKQSDFNETPENRFVYGSSGSDRDLFDKIKKGKELLGSFIDVRNGIATKSGKKSFLANSKVADTYKKLLEAPDLFRYGFEWPGVYINYDRDLLHRPRKEETFLSNKILIQRVSSRLICSFDNEQYYTFNSVNNLVLKDGANYNLFFLLGILNSKLIDYFYRKNYSLDASYTITVTKTNLDSLPIPTWNNNDDTHKRFSEMVEQITVLTKNITALRTSLASLIKSKCELEKLSKKLQNWHELEFKDFLKELKKAKVQLGLSEEAEWMQYFNEQKQKAQELKSEINQVDAEIDQMVYQLYGLTDEDIKVVEGKR